MGEAPVDRMSDAPLLTLRDIARELRLPESTVRYYRDAFAAHIATVGTGRRRRYPAEAVAVLRSIAEGYGAGKTREEIEFELGGPVQQASAGGAGRAHVPAHRLETDEVLATILDGERERREAMWQMARELVRLGEAVERQQGVLGGIAEQLTHPANRTLPAAGSTADPVRGQADTAAVTKEVQALREELANERELVERLRKSKLEIERRAAEAEARLAEEGRGPRPRRPSVLGRLLSRQYDEEGDG